MATLGDSEPPLSKPPPWVYERIVAVGGDNGPRYEASLYGPVNAFLVSYFPVSRDFMVKPQSRIRPEFINDFDPTIRISLDSYHAEVLPRLLRGSEGGGGIPDFVVVKATPSKHDDKVLLVVEIKSSDRTVEDAAEQLISYLEAFAEKHRADTAEPLFEFLYGLLLVGKAVILFTFPLNGELGTSDLVDINHNVVNTFITKIVADQW